MKIDNKLDKLFGSSGSFAGYILIVAGIFISFSESSIFGIIVTLVGLFFTFTTTGIIVEPENTRYKFHYKFFGFIKSGSWIDLSEFKEITVMQSSLDYRTYSMTNRTTSYNQKDFRIFLLDKNHQHKIPLKKFKTKEKALSEIKDFSKFLNMAIVKYNPKK